MALVGGVSAHFRRLWHRLVAEGVGDSLARQLLQIHGPCWPRALLESLGGIWAPRGGQLGRLHPAVRIVGVDAILRGFVGGGNLIKVIPGSGGVNTREQVGDVGLSSLFRVLQETLAWAA